MEAYRAKLDAAPGYFHWLADRARARFDLRSSDGRMDRSNFCCPPCRDSRQTGARRRRERYAGYLGVEPGLVLDEFKRASIERRTPGAGEQRGHAGNVRGPQAPAPKARPEIPTLERILLNALLSSETARREVLPRLGQSFTAHFATHEIFEALRLLSEGGQEVTFALLDARLGETSRTLLHEIVAADEIGNDEACLAQAEACLKRLDEDFRRRQLTEVKARVRNAEREGNVQEALGWMAELHRLEREASEPGSASPP